MCFVVSFCSVVKHVLGKNNVLRIRLFMLCEAWKIHVNGWLESIKIYF